MIFLVINKDKIPGVFPPGIFLTIRRVNGDLVYRVGGMGSSSEAPVGSSAVMGVFFLR